MEIRPREWAGSALVVGADDCLRGRIQPFQAVQRSANAGRVRFAARVVGISNANQNLCFARRTTTLLTVIGYHRLPPRRGGTWRRFNSLATAP